MNRIVLIGNGFDLAHGLKTSYRDFINWYWENLLRKLVYGHARKFKDCLCSIQLIVTDQQETFYSYFFGLAFRDDYKSVYDHIQNSPKFMFERYGFFDDINKSIETKYWVDIENEYYKHLKRIVFSSMIDEEEKTKALQLLHSQMAHLRNLLADYLQSRSVSNKRRNTIHEMLYSPISEQEVSPKHRKDIRSYIDSWILTDETQWQERLWQYGINDSKHKENIQNAIQHIKDAVDYKFSDSYPNEAMECAYRIEMFHQYDAPLEVGLPEHILFVSFNYTKLFEKNYLSSQDGFQFIHLHGSIDDPTSMIFGYGDELDDDYKAIQNKNENAYLEYFKSMKYLETDAYHKVLDFAESDLFQVSIFGHSCGKSDRTLLNTLFEHKNCISVKPYYFIDKEGKDHYMDITLNIARNFTDMKLMRNRVVNKTYTEAFSDERNE